MRSFVVSLARRIRKYNGSLVFATQNPGDLLSSDQGAVVATNPALLFLGAGKAFEPLRVRELRRKIARLAKLEISRCRLLRGDRCRGGAFQVVSDRPDAEGILSGFKPGGRKTITALAVTDDAQNR